MGESLQRSRQGREGAGVARERVTGEAVDTLDLNTQVKLSSRHLEILGWNLGADQRQKYKYGSYENTGGTESPRTG